jgi:hypothetical protein
MSDWGTFWSAVSAIFTAIAAVSIIVGIKQFKFDAWLKAQEIFMDNDFTDKRAEIYTRLDNLNQPWTTPDKEEAKKVCRKMEELAALVPFLSKKIILDAWDDPIAKTWLVLGPVVKEEQKRCGWPTKWHAFESLGQEAIKKLTREGRNPQRKT